MMNKPNVRPAVIFLLLLFIPFSPFWRPAEAGGGGNDPGLRRIELALERARDNKKSGERLVKQILYEIGRTQKAVYRTGIVEAAKDSSKVIAAMPDSCKSPSAPSPLPIPYPNIGKSADTTKGTKKVKVGAQPIAVKGMDFVDRATGDEAGSRALLDHLRKVRAEVEVRQDFVAGVCKKCKLVKRDKQALLRWLSTTRKDVRQQTARFDEYVRRIEQARRAHIKR